MRIVHRVAREAALEQVAAPALTKIDHARVPPMRLAQHGAQTVGGVGQQDQMDVIVHQTPRETARAARCRSSEEQLEIGAAIVVGEEDRQPTVAALGDVMRNARNDDASEPGHAVGLAPERKAGN